MKDVVRKTPLPSPKLVDVAQYAGVSPATVSRVLNNTAPVHESTRERVQAAIAMLGYQHPLNTPDSQATSGTIALLLTDILNPFFLEVIHGVEDEADITAHEPLHQPVRSQLRLAASRPGDDPEVGGVELEGDVDDGVAFPGAGDQLVRGDYLVVVGGAAEKVVPRCGEAESALLE